MKPRNTAHNRNGRPGVMPDGATEAEWIAEVAHAYWNMKRIPVCGCSREERGAFFKRLRAGQQAPTQSLARSPG